MLVDIDNFRKRYLFHAEMKAEEEFNQIIRELKKYDNPNDAESALKDVEGVLKDLISDMHKSDNGDGLYTYNEYNSEYTDGIISGVKTSIEAIQNKRIEICGTTKKKGRWISSNGIPYTYYNSFTICSECGYHPKEISKFCPNCGYPMEEKMVAMLKELEYDLYHALCHEIHGKEDCPCTNQTTSCLATFRVCDADRAIGRTIQQKINTLKENKETS